MAGAFPGDEFGDVEGLPHDTAVSAPQKGGIGLEQPGGDTVKTQ